jgi:hypothetical protein
VLIIGTPLGAGYLTTVLSLHLLHTRIEVSRWWLVPIAALSVGVCVGVERLTRRLLPLAALLKLSMLFPDRAPSRMKIARRALSVNRLAERGTPAAAGDAASSAEQALALITALTAHDRRTRGHSERVRLFTELLADQLRLSREAKDKLRWSSLLHDIGKLQVAVEILNKPAKLNDSEWNVIAAHPVNGEVLLGPLVEWLGEWGGAVRQHHEKFDGTGYPDGTAGNDICRAARIVSIADSYEVMTAHRAYKKPMATVAARAELARCAGTQFDPGFVRAFLAISLPRLLWAMGPGSLLMNLPLLRALAEVGNKGALATTQTGALTATAVAVISGTAGASVGHAQVHERAVLASRPAPAAVSNQPSASTLPAQPGTQAPLPARPVVHPITDITVTPAQPAPSASAPRPAGAPQPAGNPQPPTPVTSSPAPPSPVAAPAAAVSFRWVPAPTIGSSTASIGYTADDNAATVRCSLDGAPAQICDGGSVSYSNLADSQHTVRLWAENADGVAGSSIETAFVVDTAGATVSWTAVPAPVVASSHASFAFDVTDAAATSFCSLDGATASECTNPVTLTGLADGPHAVSVYSVDPLGNAGPSIQTTFTVDTTAPTVTLTSAIAPLISTSSVSLSFGVDDPAAATFCAFDGAPAIACGSPYNLDGLTDGPHTVAVHAVDAAGNVGPSVVNTFIVDTTAPAVISISAPSAPVPSRSVSIPFSVDDPSAATLCSFDGAPFAACSNPAQATGLSDGSHTIDIYAVDPAGNASGVSRANFVVSATAPTVSLSSVPPSVITSSTATVGFTVDDDDAAAWCSLDGAAPVVCTAPATFDNLADGRHTVAVYAVNGGGVRGGTVTTAFIVDTVAPTVTITSAPSGTVSSAQANIVFSIDDPSAAAHCSIDGAPATVCSSPLTLGNLVQGAHTVAIYASDAAGNSGPSQHSSFTIDDIAPVVTFVSTPPASSASRNATVGFTANDSGAALWCVLDSGAAQQCATSVTYSGLANGNHTVSVYAVDQAGNRGATVSTTFAVTASGPVLLTTPSAVTYNNIVTFTWVNVPSLKYEYSFDGVTWYATTSHNSNTDLVFPGTHTFHLRGVDPHGVRTAETTFSFKVI